MALHAVVVSAADRPGLLYQLTKVFADHGANITSVDIHPSGDHPTIYFESAMDEGAIDRVLSDLGAVPGVVQVGELPASVKIYGKRIIVMGGGAQVGFVAMGAISSEADRHNIRGERISIDTIPLVGERELAAAVRSVVRLPRVKLLVLAGSIMGGEITEAVEEVRRQGLYVISLNMAGGVPDAADLVVSDPVQAGVMAVMAVAELL
jgi:energy-converting hydrogenase B subunit Q